MPAYAEPLLAIDVPDLAARTRVGTICTIVKPIDMAPVGVLPAYDRPPVVEVALAIQFESAIGYRSLELGHIAETWSSELPVVEERPALPPMMVQPEAPSLELRVSGEVETPRLWMMNEGGNRLVQLQQDRLVVNWRKLPADTPYPRYSSIREFLVESWELLEGVIDGLHLAAPKPSICEVVYVNHIGADSGWYSAGDTSAIIALWNEVVSDGFLPPACQSGFFSRYELPNDRGWLTIDGQSISMNSYEDRLVMNLISRGPSTSPNLNGALSFMDVAHEWIVRGFTSVTTKNAHEIWKRTV